LKIELKIGNKSRKPRKNVDRSKRIDSQSERHPAVLQWINPAAGLFQLSSLTVSIAAAQELWLFDVEINVTPQHTAHLDTANFTATWTSIAKGIGDYESGKLPDLPHQRSSRESDDKRRALLQVAELLQVGWLFRYRRNFLSMNQQTTNVLRESFVRWKW
jgi:hypothetical protein